VGAYTSFVVTFGVIFISLLVGTSIGVISAYVGGHWDHFVVPQIIMLIYTRLKQD